MLQSSINANSFGSTFAFLPTLKAKLKNAKEPPSQRTTKDQMNGQTIYRQEGRTANKQFGNMAGEVLLLSRSARLNSSNSIELLCYITATSPSCQPLSVILWRQRNHIRTDKKRTLCKVGQAVFAILRKSKREATPPTKGNASCFTFAFAPTHHDRSPTNFLFIISF